MIEDWDLEEAEEEGQKEPARLRRRRRPDREQRGNWYLLTGFIIGLALGLLTAWVLSPVQFVDTSPSTLAGASKDDYRRIIALAYQSDGNIERARERLRLLDGSSAIPALAAQAQRMLAGNLPTQEARALAELAADLGKAPGAVAPRSSATAISAVIETERTPEPTQFATLPAGEAILTPTNPPVLPSATVTATARPTATFRPTATMIPTLSTPFSLVEKKAVCDGSTRPGMLEIQIMGADEQPLPGVRVHVTWQDGEEVFYTGLFPERNPGFADFAMATGVMYNLRVGETSPLVTGLSTEGRCGWQLSFMQGD